MDTSSDTKENLTNGDINGEVNGHDKTEKTSPLMCKFTLVNSYGSTELGCKMAQDGQPLKLSHRTYVAVDWNPLAQEKFYDDKAAEVYLIEIFILFLIVSLLCFLSKIIFLKCSKLKSRR